MAEKISLNFVAQAQNGPGLSWQGYLTVDAYNKIEVTIAAAATIAILLGRDATP